MKSDNNENDNNIEDQGTDVKETNEIPEITMEEFVGCHQQTQKKGKAADRNGNRAEDIKACSKETKEMVRQIFNEVIKQKRMHTRSMAKNKNKSDTQKRRR